MRTSIFLCTTALLLTCLLSACIYDVRYINTSSTDVPLKSFYKAEYAFLDLYGLENSGVGSEFGSARFSCQGWNIVLQWHPGPHTRDLAVDSTVFFTASNDSLIVTDTLMVIRERYSRYNVAFDISDKLLFVCWINTGGDAGMRSLNLRVYDLISGKVIITRNDLVRSDYLMNPAIAYDSMGKFLWVVFDAGDKLCYICVPESYFESKRDPVVLPVVPGTRERMRYPVFLRSSQSLYLVHTCGLFNPDWSLHLLAGEKGIGISRLTAQGTLADYRTLYEEQGTGDKFVIVDDTLYYYISVEGTKDMKMRMLALRDLDNTKAVLFKRVEKIYDLY